MVSLGLASWSKVDISSRLLSVGSSLEVSKVLLHDIGITSSPTYCSEGELTYYLVDSFRRSGIVSFRSKRTGIPHILDESYLGYILATGCSEELRGDILRILDYMRYSREYEYLVRRYKSLSRKRTWSWGISFLKPDSKTGRFRLSLEEVRSPYNTLLGNVDLVKSITDIYYSYFERVTGYSSGSTSWSFFDNFSRDEEYKWLRLVMEGSLEPTNREVLAYWDGYTRYLTEHSLPLYRDLYDEITSAVGAMVGSVEGSSDYRVKYIDEYSIGFYDSSSVSFSDSHPMYFQYICWDSSLGRPLPFENQLRGIGGEFVNFPQFDGDIPYKVEYHDGSYVWMYKRVGGSSLGSGVGTSVLLDGVHGMFGSYYVALGGTVSSRLTKRYSSLLRGGSYG